MKLINISNKKRKIFLFCRNDEGKQVIVEDEDFFPYYFEPDNHGEYKAIDGQKLKKIFCTEPGMVRKQRSNESYEADIVYTRRYMIDKIKQIAPTKIKWSLIDIEVKADEFPNVKEVKYPVSCISVYNNFKNEIKTFWLPDYDGDERKLFNAFIDYMEQEKFDLWMSWNTKFDYPYLYNRYKKLFGKRADFARAISPIKQGRRAEWGKLMNEQDKEDVDNVWFPSGISIIDLMQWFKIYTLNKRKSYALDYIAQEDLKEESCGDMEFGKLTEEIKIKNINDVNRMLKLEKKFNLIQHYDWLRCYAKVEFEDLYHNSRIFDLKLLTEAKKRNQVLPNKKSSREQEDFEGAYRAAFETGRFFDIHSYDISGAYLYSIINLCLDSENLREKQEENTIAINITDRESNKIIRTCFVKQNNNTILPTIVKEIVEEKNKFKSNLKALNPETEEYKIAEEEYNAFKVISLSAWGVIGNKGFRRYDATITSLITSVVRDCLHYIKDKVEEKGYKVIYLDTDGLMIDDKGKDISEFLNQLIVEWAMERFGKKLDIHFECEGLFEKLFINTICRYKGYLRTKTGLKEVIKGVEIKRKDSTIFMVKFQDTLFNKLMDKESKEDIIKWIKSEMERLKTLSIEDIAIPCKMNKKPEKYKNIPIWVRALAASPLKKRLGELYYYIYIKPIKIGTENEALYLFKDKKMATKTAEGYLYELGGGAEFIVYRKKEILLLDFKKDLVKTTQPKDIITNVMAFDKNNKDHVSEIDYGLMIQRNILNKVGVIFEAMKWSMNEIKI